MAKADKILQKMRNNPRDWGIETFKAVADRFGIPYRQRGTSHVTFRRADGKMVTIPTRKPIKSVYVPLFLEFLEGLQ